MNSTTPLLEVKKLSKSFKKGEFILKEVSFSLFKNDFAVLAGANGSGKTVLMNHLNGLETPSKGALFFNGIPYKKLRGEIFKKVGLIFQNSDLQFVCPDVRNEIAFGPVNLGTKKVEIKQQVEEIADHFNLTRFLLRDPHTLSGGEKKRVAVAGVVIMQPELLVLDEPFTGLDWHGVVEVLQTLLLLHSQGMTILLITHDLDKCINHANRLLILDKGELKEDDNPQKIIHIVESYGIKKPLTGSWLPNLSSPQINKKKTIKKQPKRGLKE